MLSAEAGEQVPARRSGSAAETWAQLVACGGGVAWSEWCMVYLIYTDNICGNEILQVVQVR